MGKNIVASQKTPIIEQRYTIRKMGVCLFNYNEHCCLFSYKSYIQVCGFVSTGIVYYTTLDIDAFACNMTSQTIYV